MKRFLLLMVLLLTLMQVSFAQCNDDCVWPGDMNANGIANCLDVLALGLAWGEVGPSRTDNSTDWEALDADDWAGSLPVSGTNHKHADADGDGELTEMDLIPINLNYNKTNNNFTGLLGSEIVGSDLFVVPQSGAVTPGGSLFLDIHLGDGNNEITNLYGIGFQLKLDTQYVADVLFDFSDNWIAGAGDEVLQYGKFSGDTNHAGVAISRTDGSTITGSGIIARVEIVIVDVVLALEIDSTDCLPFSLDFENVLGINSEEVDLMISASPDSVNLKHASQVTSILEPKAAVDFELELYPNPIKGKGDLFVKKTEKPIDRIVWYNQLGQALYKEDFSKNEYRLENHKLRIPNVPSGLYFLVLHSGSLKTVKKILLE